MKCFTVEGEDKTNLWSLILSGYLKHSCEKYYYKIDCFWFSSLVENIFSNFVEICFGKAEDQYKNAAKNNTCVNQSHWLLKKFWTNHSASIPHSQSTPCLWHCRPRDVLWTGYENTNIRLTRSQFYQWGYGLERQWVSQCNIIEIRNCSIFFKFVNWCYFKSSPLKRVSSLHENTKTFFSMIETYLAIILWEHSFAWTYNLLQFVAISLT